MYGDIHIFLKFNDYETMRGGSHATTAWHVLSLRMEETASRYGG
jgi:hypothetical protein